LINKYLLDDSVWAMEVVKTVGPCWFDLAHVFNCFGRETRGIDGVRARLWLRRRALGGSGGIGILGVVSLLTFA
jgi:hypothetical protein